MSLIYIFGARLVVSLRNGPSRTNGYGEGGIGEETADIAQKAFQAGQLCWAAGRTGV